MFQTNVLKNIKTHILCSIIFLKKIVPFLRYVKKYSTSGQDADDNVTWQMCTGYWISEATNTLLEYEYVLIVASPQ